MANVGIWDPAATPGPAGDAPPMGLVRRAAGQLDAAGFGLTGAERARLAPWMTAPHRAWDEVAERAAAADVIAWIRLLTLAEAQLAGFEAGAKSPVVALARVLRRRREYPAELTRWIKANTANRFLPHGSLADRLNG